MQLTNFANDRVKKLKPFASTANTIGHNNNQQTRTFNLGKFICRMLTEMSEAKTILNL